jgi:hypothetical protein
LQRKPSPAATPNRVSQARQILDGDNPHRWPKFTAVNRPDVRAGGQLALPAGLVVAQHNCHLSGWFVQAQAATSADERVLYEIDGAIISISSWCRRGIR